MDTSAPVPACPAQREPGGPRRAAPLHHDLLAFGLALVMFGAFFAQVFHQAFTSNNYIAPSDDLDFGLAAFLSPQTPWSDALFSGFPVAADPQSLTWYPVFQVVRVLGLGWNVFMVFPYVLAGAGSFLLVRRLSGSSIAGLFSGFAFGFSGVMLAHLGHFNQIHAAAWLPLVIYGLALIREGRCAAGTATGSLAFGLMWLAGHPQAAVYTVYLSAGLIAGWTLMDHPGLRIADFRSRIPGGWFPDGFGAGDTPSTRARRFVLWSVALVALGFALAAISILPMVELGDLSRRSANKWEVYVSKALPPWQLLTLPLPYAFGGFRTWTDASVAWFGDSTPVEMTGYVGVLPLALAVAGLCLRGGVRAEARLWLGLTVVAALLCLGAATPVGTLFFYAPGYASFRVPARHFFIVSFCLSTLSGIVLGHLTRRGEDRRRAAATVAVACGVALVAFFVFAKTHPDVEQLLRGSAVYRTWALGIPLATAAVPVALLLAAGFVKRTATAAIVLALPLTALEIGDVTLFNFVMNRSVFRFAEIAPERVTPHPRVTEIVAGIGGGGRVLAADGSRNRFLLPNLTRAWNVPAAGGTGSLGIERYLDVLGMGGPGDIYPESLARAHRGPDLFSVRYVFVPDQNRDMLDVIHGQPDRWTAVEALRYKEDDPDTAYTVFRNGRALPRAWCASDVVHANAAEVIAAVRTSRLPPDGSAFDPERTAVVERGTIEDWPSSTPSARRATVVQRPTRGAERQYVVDSEAPCVLVLGDVWYPWWRASVDGHPVAVNRVNHAQIGVVVPRGAHMVRLWLRPVMLWLGAAVTSLAAAGWVGVVIAAAWPGWRRRAGRLSGDRD